MDCSYSLEYNFLFTIYGENDFLYMFIIKSLCLNFKLLVRNSSKKI